MVVVLNKAENKNLLGNLKKESLCPAPNQLNPNICGITLASITFKKPAGDPVGNQGLGPLF